MTKNLIVGTVAVFILWQVMDFVIHGVLLQSLYAAKPQLWRPMEEVKFGLLFGTVFLSALFFTLLYGLGFAKADLKISLLFGFLVALAMGVGTSIGTYAVQPIQFSLALSWLAGTIAEAVAAAVVLHWVYRGEKG